MSATRPASETTIRVRYAETDQMRVAYHARYLEWFEVARTDLLRHLGFPYRHLEEQGWLLPVIEAQVRFMKPAFYDDILTISCALAQEPGSTIALNYDVRCNGDCLAQGRTVHAFVRPDRTPTRPPRDLLAALRAVEGAKPDA